MPPEIEPRLDPRERYGDKLVDEWRPSLSDEAIRDEELAAIQAIAAAEAAALPPSPADVVKRDTAVTKIQEVIDALSKFQRGIALDADTSKAVEHIPPFVGQILSSINLVGASPSQQAEVTPLVYSLVHHAMIDPELKRSTRVGDLIRDVLRNRSTNETLAADILSGLSKHAIQKGIDIDDTRKGQIEAFLQSEGREKPFEKEEERRRRAPETSSAPPDIESDKTKSPQERAFAQKIEVLTDRLKPLFTKEELDWVASFETEPKFIAHYQERLAKVAADMGVPTTNEAARKKLSEDYTTLVMKTMVSVYSRVLSEDPDEEFEKKSKKSDIPGDNPSAAATKFIDLVRDMSQKLHRSTNEDLRDLKFHRLVEDKQIDRSSVSGQSEQITVPRTVSKEVDGAEFMEYLVEVFEANKGFIAYGHNIRFQIDRFKPAEGDKGGASLFYKQIAGYAETELPSQRIDTVFRLPGSELIQAAAVKYQAAMYQIFQDRGWMVTPDLVSKELLENDAIVEKGIKEELREQYRDVLAGDMTGLSEEQQLKRIKENEWKIDWAFQMARAECLGVSFMFHEITSYADPNLTPEGDATYTGSKGYDGLFDIFYLAKKYQIKPFELADAVYVPYTINWGVDRDYDHEEVTKEGKKRWKETFQMGKAAYTGTFLEGQKLFIDLGNTLSRSGGYFTNGGDALRSSYQEWLAQEGLLKDRRSKKLSFGDATSVAKGWKVVENIGIDVLRNYADEFLTDAIKDETELNTPVHADNMDKVPGMKGLAGYLHDRYFGTHPELAKSLLAPLGLSGKASVEAYIEAVLTSPDVSYRTRRKALLKDFFRRVETVMLFEQSPTHFVTLEKPRDTEYGVTLQSLLQEGMGGATQEQNSELFSRTRADLQYVQETLRRESIEDMHRMMDDPRRKNLYGDLSSGRSEVLGGRGLVLDEDYIVKKLGARFTRHGDPAEAADRIERAKKMYRDIYAEITRKPTEADVLKNKAIAGDKDADHKAAILAKARRGGFKSRAEWMTQMNIDGIFGHSTTSQLTAIQFTRFASYGSDTIKRTCERTADTSEQMQRSCEIPLWLAVKEAATEGQADTTKAYEKLKGWYTFKTDMSNYLAGPTVESITHRFVQLMTTVFMEDDKVAKSKLQRLEYSKKNKPKSISDKFVDGGRPLHSWDYDKRAGFINYVTSDKVAWLKPYESGTGEKWKVTTASTYLGRIPGVGNVLKKIPWVGRLARDKKIQTRDWANDVSGKSLKTWNEGTFKNLFLHHYLPYFLLVMFLITAGAIKVGSKDMALG